MRAVIIWKILLIGFHFDIRCEKVSNIMLTFSPLQFSYELGLAINLVASEYSANSFRRRGERALLYYKGLQVFVSALHKARNSDPASLTEDKALFK